MVSFNPDLNMTNTVNPSQFVLHSYYHRIWEQATGEYDTSIQSLTTFGETSCSVLNIRISGPLTHPHLLRNDVSFRHIYV